MDTDTTANIDASDARKRDLEAQNPDKNTSWLYRNINPIMGIMVLIFSFVFFLYVLNFDFSNGNQHTKDIVIYLLGAVTSILTMVVGYYFGSSKGSSDKNKYMTKP